MRNTHTSISSVWRSGLLPKKWERANPVIICKGNRRDISPLCCKKTSRLKCIGGLSVGVFDRCGSSRTPVWFKTLWLWTQSLSPDFFRSVESSTAISFWHLLPTTSPFVTCFGFWKVIGTFGCPSHFLEILREFHLDMSARVVQGGKMSWFFNVNVAVERGCALATIIFTLFLEAATFVFRHGVSAQDCASIKFRLGGSLFNLHHMQAVTKTPFDTILDLQYADTAALLNHNTAGASGGSAAILCEKLAAISAYFRAVWSSTSRKQRFSQAHLLQQTPHST